MLLPTNEVARSAYIIMLTLKQILADYLRLSRHRRNRDDFPRNRNLRRSQVRLLPRLRAVHCRLCRPQTLSHDRHHTTNSDLDIRRCIPRHHCKYDYCPDQSVAQRLAGLHSCHCSHLHPCRRMEHRLVQYAVPRWLGDLPNADPIFEHVVLDGFPLGLLLWLLACDAQSAGRDAQMGSICLLRLDLRCWIGLCVLCYASMLLFLLLIAKRGLC